MSVPPIGVLSVSWRSAVLLRDLFANLRALADHPDALRLWVADNTAGTDQEVVALDFPALTVVPVDVQGAQMSVAHAAGLNALLSRVDAEVPYILTADPDVAVLQRGWDTTLRRALETQDVVAVGAPYPPWKIGKYHDFPSPPFALWRAEALRALSPDWQPYARTTARRALDFVLRQTFWPAKLLDRVVWRPPRRQFRAARRWERFAGVVSKDTGWEIAARARQRGWRAECFEVIDSPDHNVLLAADPQESYRALAAVFELYAWEGRPFVPHRNSTRTRICMNLWIHHNILIYQDQTDTAAQTARWREYVSAVLSEALLPNREA
ncbi:MAG: hypothetical protein EHM39_10065 [Chloroflexi bacterium]|nr:MAG: hypothetical protein EHM39_10065 [Chloroflexota bacterium]